MSTSLPPAVVAWLDQESRRTADAIREHGVQITYVSLSDDFCCDACRAGVPSAPVPARADEKVPTSFAYTVGLFGIGHPELLVFGLDQAEAMSMLNTAAARVRTKGDLVPGQVLRLERAGRRVLVERVPNPGDIVFSANRFYRRPDAASVDVLQLTWADASGRFPEDPGYALAPWEQPRPGDFRA